MTTTRLGSRQDAVVDFRVLGPLEVYIDGLRKALGPERIELRGTGYVLHVAPERARLAELRVHALELDAEARLAAGEHDNLIRRRSSVQPSTSTRSASSRRPLQLRAASA
jgi:hypothetical protein